MKWLIRQRGFFAAIIGVSFFIAALVFRYRYDTWWPTGKVLGVIAGMVAVLYSVSTLGGTVDDAEDELP